MNASRIKRPVSRLSRVIATLSALVSTAIIASPSSGAIIYESGTLGATGVAYGDTEGTNINWNVYAGVRFELARPVITTQVGGHFVDAFGGGTFFGAIVKLTGPDDFPDSGNLATTDVLGVTQLTFPSPSAEAYGDLALTLSPSWYALVFGSGLFGTNGRGGAVRNGVDHGSPEYTTFSPTSGFGWIDHTTSSIDLPNHRFVVLGTIVPEPPTFLPSLLASCIAAILTRARTK